MMIVIEWVARKERRVFTSFGGGCMRVRSARKEAML